MSDEATSLAAARDAVDAVVADLAPALSSALPGSSWRSLHGSVRRCGGGFAVAGYQAQGYLSGTDLSLDQARAAFTAADLTATANDTELVAKTGTGATEVTAHFRVVPPDAATAGQLTVEVGCAARDAAEIEDLQSQPRVDYVATLDLPK